MVLRMSCPLDIFHPSPKKYLRKVSIAQLKTRKSSLKYQNGAERAEQILEAHAQYNAPSA